MTQQWHVAYCDARSEQETVEDIHELGYESYCPQERFKKFKNGRKIIYEAALFSRYCFVRFSQDDMHWPEILAVDGVCDILRNNGQPSPLPDAVVPKLQRMQLLGLFDHTKAPNPFPPGSKVMLDDDGPFAELVAKVLRVRSADRCDVLLRYLGREMMVNISMARLAHV